MAILHVPLFPNDFIKRYSPREKDKFSRFKPLLKYDFVSRDARVQIKYKVKLSSDSGTNRPLPHEY